MNPLPTPQTAPTPPTETGKYGPPRWQVTIYQVLFGIMAVALGGFISAEPTLYLERQEDGRVEAWYALEAYGRFPTLRNAVWDLVRYEVTQSESRGTGGSSSGSWRSRTTYTLVLWDRDGSSFGVGQTWDLLAIGKMIDGSHKEPWHEQRITAGKARRYGGWSLGGFGLLLLSGAVWNVFLMGTGLGSPKDRASHA
jgi:hypothetical protein